MANAVTATLFFLARSKKYVGSKAAGRSMDDEARALMMQWLALTDPLLISEDPECEYGWLPGFAN